MYMVIDHNPVNGYEVQKSHDARYQVVMQLNLVKLESDEDMYMVEIRSDTAQQIRSVNMLH